MDNSDEMVSEFLMYCSENLEEFENNLLSLEKDISNCALLDSMFRMVHSIKGASGFFAFNNLESLTHETENVLDLLRQNNDVLNQEIISVFLEVCDSIKLMFKSIEKNGHDGKEGYQNLKDKLYNFEQAFNDGKDQVSQLNNTSNTVSLDPTQIEALASLGMDVREYESQNATQEKNNKNSSASIQKKETIRVDVPTLNKLVNLAGELVLVRNQILELAKNNNSQAYGKSFTNLDLVTGDIQKTLMGTRMQPISTLWSKVPRIARDLCKKLDKDVEIIMEGESTELDKTILESISDPMTHIIRNCIDHGIEETETREKLGKSRQGVIKLVAEHKGNWIHITVSDDGQGISPDSIIDKVTNKGLYTEMEIAQMSRQEILNLIFLPGFSTKETVSNLSGRGVGMDVIKSNIAKINGTVDIESREGKGTILRIKLPLTLAIIPAIIASIGKQRYAIPQNAVQEVGSISKKNLDLVDDIDGQKFTRLRGELLPLVFADQFLSTTISNNDNKSISYLVINSDGFLYGLVIDRVIDIVEIVVKPLGAKYHDFLNLYSGATIMGDGKVALILDASKIAQRANISPYIQETLNHGLESSGPTKSNSNKLTLLFELADSTHYLLPLSKDSRIEEIQCKDIETRGKNCFAKLNDSLIKVIDLESLIGSKQTFHKYINTQKSIKVLYQDFNGQGLGIYIGSKPILFQGEYEIQTINKSKSILGTALIDNTYYEAIDLESYLSELQVTYESDLNKELKPKLTVDSITGDDIANNNQVISFTIGNMLFGINTDSVSEIMTSVDLTETVDDSGVINGILNLRGDVLVSKSLAAMLKIDEEQDHAKDRKNLIVNHHGERICLQINDVEEILTLDDQDASPVPSNIPEDINGYLKQVYKLKDNLLLLLNEESIVNINKAIEV